YRRSGGTDPSDPVKGRGRRLRNRRRETCQVHRDLIHVHVTTTDRAGSDFMQMTRRVRAICTPGSVGGATRSYGCTCYDWSYDQDVTQCATTDTLPRRAAGVTWRCEALGTT